jgi:hypothetical protein
MRRFFPLLIVIAVTVAAGWLDAQGGPTLTFGGAPNTGVQLQRSTDGGKTWSPMPLGTTTNAGALTLSPSQVNLLSGKAIVINERVDRCPSGNTINLFPSGPGSDAEEQKCQTGCTCSRKKGVFVWPGSNLSGPIVVPTAGGQSFFFDNKLSYAVIGGGVAGGILIAKSTGGGTDTGTSTGVETRTETDVVNHPFSSQFNAPGNGCNFTSSSGSVNFSGTMTNTTGIFTESNGTVISNAQGSVSQDPTTMQFTFTGTSQGTIPGLGSFTGSAMAHFDPNTNVTGTLQLGFACGTVPLTFSGHR